MCVACARRLWGTLFLRRTGKYRCQNLAVGRASCEAEGSTSGSLRPLWSGYGIVSKTNIDMRCGVGEEIEKTIQQLPSLLF